LQYAFAIKPHANARYALSMDKLALIEMQCMLHALNAQATVTQEKLAGTRFILIETEPIDEQGWRWLSGHSGICFAALKDGEWLKPLELRQAAYMDDDLAQVLKYKGKTNPDFTQMMIHCALAASDFAFSLDPLLVLDPLCGRGTSLFCALQEGHHAAGVEIDKKAVHEADAYFKRYLQYHRYKHKRETGSATLPDSNSAAEIRYGFATSADAYKAGDTRSLRLFQGTAALADRMVGAESSHLIVCDLPYGVQHAARDDQGMATMQRLMHDSFPAFRRALKTGGAAAVSFNTYTLRREALCEAMGNAGLRVLTDAPFNDFSHWVEQAVNRDMVIAVKR